MDHTLQDMRGHTILHFASENGHLEVVKLLLSKYKVPGCSTENSSGCTPLHCASKNGHLEVVEVLVSEFKAGCNKKDIYGRTPLHYACEKGHLEVVRLLATQAQVNINARDEFGCTPLLYAFKKGNVCVVGELILKFKADLTIANKSGRTILNIKDCFERTVLQHACILGATDLAISLLFEHKVDLIWEKLKPFHLALENSKFELVLSLMNKCYDYIVYQVDELNHTLLHLACKIGATEVVYALIYDYEANINVRNYVGKTPCHLAIESHHFQLAHCLLSEFGCDPNIADFYGQTLLHLACKEGDIDIVSVLIREHNANLNAITTISNDTPFSIALNNGKLDVVLLLICEFGCDPNMVKTKCGKTLLQIACKNGDHSLVRILCENGANVNLSFNNSVPPLHLASFYCDYNLVRLLCEHGADVDRKFGTTLIFELGCDPKVHMATGHTLLQFACKTNDHSLVCILLEHCANVNLHGRDNQPPLHLACIHGDGKLVRSLYEHGANINFCHTYFRTPLYQAVVNEKFDIANILICELGCDPNVYMDGESTLLHYGCRMGLSELVRTLIHYDANVTFRDQINEPFHIAAKNNQVDVACILLDEFGFDPNMRNTHGQTPLHVAAHFGHVKVVESLLQRSSSPLQPDHYGNTPLHLASKANQLNCVKSLVRSKAPIFVRNKRGQTTIDVASLESKAFLAIHIEENRMEITSTYDEVLKLAKKKYSGSNYITRVFVLGNSGAGKSSFIESLKRERFFQSFLKVTVPPHTAGIIPSVFVSEQYGRVMFYDFAGDAEYYSSHAAIFESLATSKKGSNLFVIVVDMRKDTTTIKTTLHYWLYFIQYQNFKKHWVVVVGSHYDLATNKKGMSQLLSCFCESIQNADTNATHFMLDCRDPRSSQIGRFRKQILSWVSQSPSYEISHEASYLLGLLEKDFSEVTACSVMTLESHIRDSGVWLPESLYRVLLELHEVGVLLLLGDCTKSSDHVIFNVPRLTNEVHKLLFSQSAISEFQESQQIAPFNIGILPESVLTKILPPYITKECLIHLQYCQQISHDWVSTYLSLEEATCESFLYFPALCKVDKIEVSWKESGENSFSIGWLALCTDARDYFPPRFLHVLLLRLVYGFTVPDPLELQTLHTSLEYRRRCTMWKRGVKWSSVEDVDCMVELVNASKGIVVLSKCSRDRVEKCISIFTEVVNCVLQAKIEFCHSINPLFFFLDSVDAADYLDQNHHFFVSEVEKDLSMCKPVSLSLGGGHRKLDLSYLQCMRRHTQWNSLFPIECEEVLHLLHSVVSKIFELASHLGAPSHYIETLQTLPMKAPSDVDQRRRDVVRWWMNSSPNPPCWWTLTEALRNIEMGVLADEIRQEHSLHVELQKKMVDEDNQDMKPDEKFLHLLSEVVGSRWSSVAVSLSLNDKDIEKLNGKVKCLQQERAFRMLKIWTLREEATYGLLCCKLKTISIFQHSR